MKNSLSSSLLVLTLAAGFVTSARGQGARTLAPNEFEVSQTESIALGWIKGQEQELQVVAKRLEQSRAQLQEATQRVLEEIRHAHSLTPGTTFSVDSTLGIAKIVSGSVIAAAPKQ